MNENIGVKISIITINLNNRAGFQKTAESVMAQTNTDFEWIVIDGESIDGSRDLIEQYSERMSYWVSEPDTGIYHAMNKGIAASHGEYLLFLNSGDCLHDKDVLSHVVPLLNGKDYYIGNIRIGNEIQTVKISNYDDLVSYAVRFIPHQGTFMHRRVFAQYGMYDENLRIAGDWAFFYKSIVFGDVEAESLPYIISIYELDGISVRESTAAKMETAGVRRQHHGVYVLARFYKENYEKMAALTDSKWFYFIFRVCYWIYRRTSGRKHG